ncbi:hypothetical protein K0M31_009032 [Melipona bicolor]|uniref:Phenoloxidase-activating factor 2 n=1 Tax=Melipona bicolor TaxID=60889 RepID=A0AA40KJH2_9HYME|nr:hypothetical protein K0M31_009032 [Melipona bicolor]
MQVQRELVQSVFLLFVFCTLSLARSSTYNKNTTDFTEHIYHGTASSIETVTQSSKCVGLNNEAGSCEYLRQCLSQEYDSNFTLATDHLCTIDNTYTGVCCSKHGSEMGKKSTKGRSFAEILPLIVANDLKQNETIFRNMSRIVWSAGHGSTTSRPRNPALRGCGTTLKSRSKLVGGRPADPTEWPWMVAILRGDQIQYCGGILITDRHVLTAAHCVYTFKPRDIKVRLGEYNFEESEETRALDFAISEIRVHRDYDRTTYENDIAILKMYRPTIFDSYIWPVCLPPIDQTFEHKDAIVTGWGTQYYGGPASTILMEVGVPVWPQNKCANSFVQRIPNTMMCAGAYEGGADACQGDSGGPLLHQLANGRWVNIGIVSWGIRCGDRGRPGIYTRVNSYLDWIFENVIF